MEYTRRRRKRRHIVRRSSNGGGRVFAALLVAGAVIYLVSASAAGTWIAQNVMAPVFQAVDGVVAGFSSTPAPQPIVQTPDQQITVPPSAGVDTVAAEVEVPAISCFALQMGVYSSQQNAQIQAADLQKRCAGGYVMEDAGRYRVLAAAYEDEQSLKQVREQLLTEGMESASYVLSTQGTHLRVSATQEQIDGIKAGFEALYTLQQGIGRAALVFDQQQQTVEDGRAAAKEMLQQIQAAQTAFAAIDAGDSPVLSTLSNCLNTCTGAVEELSGYQTQSTVDFSSKMKYTQLYIADAYAKLDQAISTT